jgi:Kef-type K+ transport system membrane component KefB/Trk K+ transport system NAD-binding subunit
MTLISLSFHFDYFPLLVVISIAWLTPILLSLLKLKKVPTVIVEIVLGFIIGHYFMPNHSTDSYHILEFLALSGFIFLMFLGGLEIDVDQIASSFPRKRIHYAGFIKNPLLVGMSHFAGAILLSYAGTLFLSYFVNIPHFWYFSLIMVTTSVGIVLPILKNRGELSSRYGQMIVIAAAVADIFSIILFTFTAFTIRNGFKIELLYILLLFLVFYIFYRLSIRLKHLSFLKKLSYQLAHAASQIQVRSTVMLMLIFVVIAQYIGEEVVLLGAFLSGLLMSTMMHKERSVLLIKLDGMGYGFFIPIFFIMVGMAFDPAAFKEFDQSLILFLVLLLLVLLAVKIIPSLVWVQLFGKRKALAGGFLMSSRLSLIIAASAIGLKLGVITPGINASFILMAVVSCLISPVLFNWINPVNITEGKKTLIVGGSSTAVLLARRMSVHGKKAIIIERDRHRFNEIKRKGIPVVYADGNDEAVYRQLHLTNDTYVVIETGDDKKNFRVVDLLRNKLMHERIITRACKMPCVEKLHKTGVESIDVHRVVATAIENFILRPTTYHDLVESFENFSVEEIIIGNKKMDGKHIKEIPFHGDAILMMVKRGNETFIPHGETYFQLGDILHVFGTQTALDDTRLKVQG